MILNLGRPILTRMLGSLFTYFARRRMAKMAAILFRLTLRELPDVEPPTVKTPHTILMLPRVIFTEDVAATFGGTGQFRVLRPFGSAMKSLASGIFPPLTHTNFYAVDDPELNTGKQAYREFLTQMWTTLQNTIQIDAVVTGNFSYWAERELGTALESLGVPFIAMHKESMKTPGLVDFIGKLYRERRGLFTGRRIVVYSEGERQLQIDSGVVEPERISVGGMPRLDRLHEWRRSTKCLPETNDGRPQVLLFSFIPKGVLPRIVRRAHNSAGAWEEELDEDFAKLSWQQLATSTHSAISRLARENPELDVVVKSKEATRERTGTFQMLQDEVGLPTNLKIVVGDDPYELIKASDVVCGFNTTALLEAICAGIPVVIPLFAEAIEERMKPYVIHMGDAVEYATSPDDLVDKLRTAALARRTLNADLHDASIRALDKWVGNSDGRAGERVRNIIRSEIEHSDRQQARPANG